MKLQALLLNVTAVLGLATTKYVLHERRFAEHGLDRGKRLDGSSITTFRIALKQSNLQHGYDYLMGTSHPSSENYGKHWTPEEVRKAFRPSDESSEAVQDWLASYGLQRGSEERGYLSVTIPVADAEKLFRAEYYEHEDHETGDVRIGCDQYGPSSFCSRIAY